MGIPQPKTNEITEQLNFELTKPRSDEFTLKRLEREIRVLLNSADAETRMNALVLRGALAAAQFDAETARQWYEKALNAYAHAPDVYCTYVGMLMSLGYMSDALAVVEKGLEANPSDASLLLQAVRATASAFQFEKFEEYAARLVGLGSQAESPDFRKILENTRWQRRLLEQAGADPGALLKRFEAAHRVAMRHGVRVQEERVSASSRGALVEWTVGCADSEIMQMNFDVAVTLAEFEPDSCESVMAFGFTSVEAIDEVEDEVHAA